MITRCLSGLSAVFVVGVAVINGAHPLVHAVEGGSLDAVLGYVNALAAQVAQGLPGDRN